MTDSQINEYRPPDRVSGGVAYSVQLVWIEENTVGIGIGHADGSLLVTGKTVFDALVDFSSGAAWALVAGDVYIARENATTYRIRVLQPRISISLNADEFRDAIDNLAESQRTSEKRSIRSRAL